MKLIDIQPGMQVNVSGGDGRCTGPWTVTKIANPEVVVRRPGEVRIVNFRRVKMVGEKI